MLQQPDSEVRHAYHFTLPEGHDNENLMWLHWLVRLRWVAILAQVLTLSFTFHVLDSKWLLAPMGLVVLLLVVVNAHAGTVLDREEDLGNTFLFNQLVVDVVALTALFLMSGGPANPFVMLYLVHVALGMIVLLPRAAVALSIAIVACYTGLHVLSVPLHLDQHFLPVEVLQPLGQWLAFAVTVGSVGVFVLGTSNSLRRYQALHRRPAETPSTEPATAPATSG